MIVAARTRFDVVGSNEDVQFNGKYLVSQSGICVNENGEGVGTHQKL